MGIGPDAEAILRKLPLPVGFSVCDLGDQISHTGHRHKPGWSSRPARDLYAEMGSGRYESIDANGKASILADLNWPLEPHPGQFDLIVDGGTSEHVFNVAQCWATIHSLCKPGGFIFFEKPHDGYREHGFFNFQGTFFHDVAATNSYELMHFARWRSGRGLLLRGVFRKGDDAPFVLPTQGKYRRALAI
jgi:SAM-dependent methyltransferase